MKTGLMWLEIIAKRITFSLIMDTPDFGAGMGDGTGKKSKNVLKLNEFPSIQQTRSLCFERVWMK